MSHSPEIFQDHRPLFALARNVSSRCLAIGVDLLVGLLMLPFNVSHLGTSAYGLWVLTASITVQFSMLELGYSGALVKFIAQYRAYRNVQGLNEIASTLFFLFTAVGAVAYAIVVGVAFNLESLFRLTPDQAETGFMLMLLIGLYVALNFPFSVYGSVATGFQRNDVNSVISIACSLLVAAVNVAALELGYGLTGLVVATTVVRVLVYFAYRLNAHRIFPALHISPSLFRWDRLREVTGFSVYALAIDWANKLNYQFDTIVIGAFLGPAPVAIWSVANRIILGTQMLSNQLNSVLFPLIVDSDASRELNRLREILLQGTRLSLVMVLPISTALIALGQPLIIHWVGPQMQASVLVLQILAVAVAIRVGNGTGTTVLKGAGCHRMLATVNIAAGIGNVILSAALIHWFGLSGVAIGTLIAILAASAILYPAACHRVGVPVRHALVHSILPPLWPAIVVGALLSVTRPLLDATLPGVLLHATLGAALYGAIFFFAAIGSRDRAIYLTKAREVLGAIRPTPKPQIPASNSQVSNSQIS